MAPWNPGSRPERLLIRTKLHRPRSPASAVERPRLLERLDAALLRPLTVISAGPGFGKTTLAAQWLEQRPIRASWLSLDRLDGDPERFSMYFVEALREVLPDGLGRATLRRVVVWHGVAAGLRGSVTQVQFLATPTQVQSII